MSGASDCTSISRCRRIKRREKSFCYSVECYTVHTAPAQRRVGKNCCRPQMKGEATSAFLQQQQQLWAWYQSPHIDDCYSRIVGVPLSWFGAPLVAWTPVDTGCNLGASSGIETSLGRWSLFSLTVSVPMLWLGTPEESSVGDGDDQEEKEALLAWVEQHRSQKVLLSTPPSLPPHPPPFSPPPRCRCHLQLFSRPKNWHNERASVVCGGGEANDYAPCPSVRPSVASAARSGEIWFSRKKVKLRSLSFAQLRSASLAALPGLSQPAVGSPRHR